MPKGIIQMFYPEDDFEMAHHVRRWQEILKEYPNAVVRFCVEDDGYHVYESEEDYRRLREEYRRSTILPRLKDAQDAVARLQRELDNPPKD